MLDDLLETAYRTFAPYPAPETLGCQCPLCRLEESQSRLRAMAVREIPDELLWRYHFIPHADKASVGEIKHFLPRYLEIVSKFQFDHFWAEVALDRLKFVNGEWTDEERALLDDWARAFFSCCLSRYYDHDVAPTAPHIENIVDIVIMLAHGNFDLSPLLEVWVEDSGLPALLHYKDLLLWGFSGDMSVLENSFAADDEGLCASLGGWARRPEVVAHFIARCDWALGGGDPLLDAVHECHGGVTHRAELETLRNKLVEWQRLQSS
ncbi:MAG: hypothetical protein LBR05_04915 [Azoarcus sp.]|jgi:hypothetical protein|nr:hypothetical protein [Azoarcus sp.]